MTTPLTDTRAIRQLLKRAAYTGDRIDGTHARLDSMGNALIRTVFNMAEAQGLSGEDMMTVLAYHALLQNEKLMDQVLFKEMTTPIRISV